MVIREGGERDGGGSGREGEGGRVGMKCNR